MIFEQGVQKVTDDFNLFKIIQSIKKLKAAVNVILMEYEGEELNEIINEIEVEYVKASIINPDGRDEESEVLKLLNNDYKKKLYY